MVRKKLPISCWRSPPSKMIDRSVPVALVRVRSIEEEARGERKEYEGTGRSHHPWENQEGSFLLDLCNFTLMCFGDLEKWEKVDCLGTHMVLPMSQN